MTDLAEANRFLADPLAAGRTLKSALARGETRVGAFLKIPSPDLVEVLASAGMEFVVADAEHGPITTETCQQMVRASEACGIPLIVRIGESESPATVCRFLDTGAAGVQLPRSSSAAIAETQLASVLHPPAGIRGLAGGRWARYGAAGSLPKLVGELPSSLAVVIQIEDVEAVDDLDALLALDGPDVYFIGPTDLAASMGLRGDRTDDRVRQTIRETAARIVAADKTAGILAASLEEAAEAVEMGIRYIGFNGESLVQWGARAALRATRGKVAT
jgi:4-hydroxy-2-oxoheptanedioate aldolase